MLSTLQLVSEQKKVTLIPALWNIISLHTGSPSWMARDQQPGGLDEQFPSCLPREFGS